MKVSIVIPVYNVERHIRRCLASVIAQTYRGEIECIIVDDASPDGSMALVREITGSYNGSIRFRIIVHTKNKGLSGARNTGIANATGSHIYLLDSDDEITPHCIEALAETALRHPGVDLVQGNLVVTDPLYRWFEISQYKFPEYTDNTTWIRQHMLSDIPVTAWNKLIRKELISSHNLWFKEGIVHEDEHWKYLSYRHISSIAFCNEPTYIYYRNEGSITEARFRDRNFHSLLSIYQEFLPEIATTDPRQYRKDLTYAVGLTKRLDQLAEPEKFIAEFQSFANCQMRHPQVPFAAKVALYHRMHPSKWLKNLCRLFYRPAYIYIKHFSHAG